MCRAAPVQLAQLAQLVLAALATLATLARAHPRLREGSPTNCGVAHYGRPSGTAQRLVQTRLGAGLADWTVRVPIPPSCRDAQVTGVEMSVCDADAAPDVAMSDALTARVHRTGQLAGTAAVNVTVHCVPPPAAPTPGADEPEVTTATPPHHADTRSTDEMLSNELSSNERISGEIMSYESEPNDVKSSEWISTVAMPSFSTTTPPAPPVSTTPAAAPPTTHIITTPKKIAHSRGKSPHALKVTIKITPGSHKSIKETEPQTYNVELPSALYRDTPAVESRQTLPLSKPHKHRARPQPAGGGAGGGAEGPLYPALLPRYMVGPLLSPLGVLRPQSLWPRLRPLLYLPHFTR